MSLNAIVRTGKNASMLLVGSMTRMVASFVFVLYCADKLGVEGFGKYSIAIHYLELFLSLTATAAGILLTRDMSRWPRHSNQLLTSAISITLLMCVFAMIVMACIGNVFNYSTDTCQALWIASAALVPASVCAIYEAVFVARERAEFLTLGIALESLFRIVLSAGLLYLGYGLLALMWVHFASRWGLLFAYLFSVKRMGLLNWSFSKTRSLRFLSRWRVFAAENWMATIYTNLDVIILSTVAGEVATGIYSAAWKIVRLGSVVAKSYTTAIFPVMSRLYAESRESFSILYRQTIRIMCAMALPAIAVVSVVPGRVIGLFYNDEFLDAIAVLQVLIWVLLLDFLNPFLSHVLFAQGKQHKSMRVAGISLVVNVVATWILVFRFGATGAAAGTVLGGLVATCFYLVAAMPRHDVIATFSLAFRVALASVGMGLAVYYFRHSDWFTLIGVGMVSYVPLLFAVRAIRLEDVRVFKKTFLIKAT